MVGQPSHGLSGTREYRVWADMRRRCRDPKTARYANYGGRGIKVCERWESFANFFADMGLRPSADHSIDRINNDGHYEPTNCRWATRSEQQKNKSGYRADHCLPRGDDHWTRQDPSRAQDVARRNIKRAHKTGSGNGNARLSEVQVKQIKTLISDGTPDTVIAKSFGVRPGTIWFIRSGKNWSHVQ